MPTLNLALTGDLAGKITDAAESGAALIVGETYIVKAQLPIQATDDGYRLPKEDHPALVYAEGRQGITEQKVPNWVRAAIRHSESVGRAFFEARWEEDRWFLTKVTDFQKW